MARDIGVINVTEPVSSGNEAATSASVGDSESHDPLKESQVCCFIIFMIFFLL